ncbi:hypothetical protein DFJ73DRAFT_962850, partial [Zopfochytrium polystomum]
RARAGPRRRYRWTGRLGRCLLRRGQRFGGAAAVEASRVRTHYRCCRLGVGGIGGLLPQLRHLEVVRAASSGVGQRTGGSNVLVQVKSLRFRLNGRFRCKEVPNLNE